MNTQSSAAPATRSAAIGVRPAAMVSTPAHTGAVRAARSALTVGSAILAGAAFAALVRVALPRTLGPTVYGEYRLAESAAEVVLLLLTLGLDTTLRRDIAHDPSSAARRLWDVVGLRMRTAVVVAVVVGGLMLAVGVSPSVMLLFTGFAAVQGVLAVANAHVAALHGTGDARWPARLGVAVRGSWTVVALAFLWARWHALWLVGALVVAECVRLAFLHQRSVRTIGLRAHPDTFVWSRAWCAATASLAVFVNYLAHNLYARLGTWILGVAATPDAVAHYTSAANVAALALLGMPLVTWILLPSAAEAHREGGGRDALILAALRMAMLGAVPTAGIIVWGAEPLVAVLFGAAFAPATAALRLLAPTIALAYLATTAAVALLEQRRERTVAGVSLVGLMVGLALTWWLVDSAPTDPATAAARAMLATELLVTVAMLAFAWRQSWTIPLIRTACGVVAAGLLALTVDAYALRLGAGVPIRGTLLALIYGVSLPLVGAVRSADVAFVRAIFRRPASHASS